MNKIVIALLLQLPILGAGQPIKVMTYNIRYDNPQDGINQWDKRKSKVFALIKKYDPDIFGIQEGLFNQLEDIKQNLPYSYIGVGRDDGKTKGEFSAIFFKKGRFSILDQGTFWLSETPEIPGSKNWDAAITRISTWAKVQDIKTKQVFYHFNTHFDHIGKAARAQSAAIIKSKIKSIAANQPVIVTGDFNCEPTDIPYLTMISTEPVALADSGQGSSEGTSCSFQVGNPCKRIDYIFYSLSLSSEKYVVITDNDGTNYPSDHLAVMTTLQLK